MGGLAGELPLNALPVLIAQFLNHHVDLGHFLLFFGERGRTLTGIGHFNDFGGLRRLGFRFCGDGAIQ